ncbi:PREDICTED: BREAKING OF ASYMMETRY IN THE STOMATAL [Prunus dulcis]|uniref:PREDICTED: BREAKING OF ASYMMETRY IN THE STOMATAL n=1 Tax=Prunus dulcis TaxID=3755 RepID=A0A5E4F5R3_PRUDU|nr:hypothetical protein L3X38_042999 [Prunus dulcis]VVA21971.1 PREDICTED: BREAKING OF ASYMMETRY IN THE STOMATAL [Prunus dulcis]
MQHSRALCHGNAILGFDLSYYMGIRDKGGGFEVQFRVHDYGCVNNFELFYHMGIRDKGGGFIDEEFIVFCFKEDGALDIVKNGKPEAPSRIGCTSRNSPRPVNRELNYGEDTKRAKRCSNEERLTGKAYDIYPTTNDEDEDEEEEEENYLGIEPHPGSIVEDRGMVSVESSDSNQSDGSTSSFAFPVSLEQSINDMINS